MPKTEKENPLKSSHPRSRSSPRTDAILARLRYIGEHVFGGDLAAYAAAVNLTEYWLRRILSGQARVRASAFVAFVESGVVSAEWLFCGTGPMLNRPDRLDPLTAYELPPAPNSRYAVFDTLAMAPGLPKKPKKIGCLAPSKKLIRDSIPAALQLFAARTENQPVLLFLGQAAMKAGIGPIVVELTQRKYVTGIALTGTAALLDYTAVKKEPAELADFAEVVKRAAISGVGLGEALGRWGFLPGDKRERSVTAIAYDCGVPVTVHAAIGDSAFHLSPALYGVEFGAALGSVSYIDALVFTAQAHRMSGDAPSLFIVGGEEEPAFQVLASAIGAGTRLAQPLSFNRLRTAWLGERKSQHSTDYNVVGNYAEIFASMLIACNAVYEGVTDEYVNKTGKHPKRKSNRRAK